MLRLCQLILTLALGAGLVGPAFGSDKERSEEQNHKYGFLAHSELRRLMHPYETTPDVAAGFVLVEANYARGRCDSVSVLETSFFTPSKRFGRRIDRVLNEACKAATKSSSISQSEETHRYQLPLFGVQGEILDRTLRWHRQNCSGLKRDWIRIKECRENLNKTISKLDPSSDLQLSEVLKDVPYTANSDGPMVIADNLFFLANHHGKQGQSDAFSDILWQALWYSLMSGESRFYVNYLPEIFNQQIEIATAHGIEMLDLRLLETVSMLGKRRDDDFKREPYWDKAIEEVKAQIASKVAIKREVTLPSEHPILSGTSYISVALLKPEFSLELLSGEISHAQVACGYGHYADVQQVQWKPNAGIISPNRADCRLEVYGAPDSSLSIRFYPKGSVNPNGTIAL